MDYLLISFPTIPINQSGFTQLLVDLNKKKNKNTINLSLYGEDEIYIIFLPAQYHSTMPEHP